MNVWNHSEHKIKDVIDDVPITYTEYKRSPNPFFADYLGGGLGLVTLQNRLHKARPVQSGRSRDCKLSCAKQVFWSDRHPRTVRFESKRTDHFRLGETPFIIDRISNHLKVLRTSDHMLIIHMSNSNDLHMSLNTNDHQYIWNDQAGTRDLSNIEMCHIMHPRKDSAHILE